MKLVTTVTSEQGIKQQEGEDFLFIKFSQEKGVICRIDLKKTDDGTPYLEIWDATGMTTRTIRHPLHIARWQTEPTHGECAICDAPLGGDKMCPYGC